MTTLHDPMTLDQMRNSLTSKASPETQANSPTLQETLAWLRDTIPLGMVQTVLTTADGLTGSYTDQAKAWSLESCMATVGTEITEDRGTFHAGVTERNSFPLGNLKQGAVVKMDLATRDKFTFVSGDRWSFWVNLTSRSQDIVRHVSSISMSFPPTVDRVTEFHLGFIDEAVARRVYEAFLHAASLCRDKKESF